MSGIKLPSAGPLSSWGVTPFLHKPSSLYPGMLLGASHHMQVWQEPLEKVLLLSGKIPFWAGMCRLRQLDPTWVAAQFQSWAWWFQNTPGAYACLPEILRAEWRRSNCGMAISPGGDFLCPLILCLSISLARSFALLQDKNKDSFHWCPKTKKFTH